MKKLMLMIGVSVVLMLTGCDKINNMSRSLDTIIGGDFDVYISGHDQAYFVDNGKITSVPDKGYYVFYPTINGKKRLVQSPINLTTIVER